MLQNAISSDKMGHAFCFHSQQPAQRSKHLSPRLRIQATLEVIWKCMRPDMIQPPTCLSNFICSTLSLHLYCFIEHPALASTLLGENISFFPVMDFAFAFLQTTLLSGSCISGSFLSLYLFCASGVLAALLREPLLLHLFTITLPSSFSSQHFL